MRAQAAMHQLRAEQPFPFATNPATCDEDALRALLEMAACPPVCRGHLDGDEDWRQWCIAKAAAAFDILTAVQPPDPGNLAAVRALHFRRPHSANGGQPSMRAFDFVAHGQTEFPDLCDHCGTAYPCATMRALDGDAAGEVRDARADLEALRARVRALAMELIARCPGDDDKHRKCAGARVHALLEDPQ